MRVTVCNCGCAIARHLWSDPTMEWLPIDTDVDINDNAAVASTMIDCFLAGITNGHAVLEALYDHVLDEPVPERLLALVRGVP